MIVRKMKNWSSIENDLKKLFWFQMDKASIIKDAISYIQQLQEEEKKLQAEVTKLDSVNEIKPSASEDSEIDHLMRFSPPKKKKVMSTSSLPLYLSSSTIELVEVSLSL